MSGVRIRPRGDWSQCTIETPLGSWRGTPIRTGIPNPADPDDSDPVSDFLVADGPAEGLRVGADQEDFETSVLVAYLVDSKGYVKWREWCKAACQDAIVPAPADEDLGGGNLNTQARGLRRVCAAMHEAGREVHVFDLAAQWNASPQAAEAIEAPAK